MSTLRSLVQKLALKSHIYNLTFHRTAMSVLVEKLNPITGVSDWVVESEDYDYHQEVARSSFADMLHDRERNLKYEAALKSAIELMHATGKKANVLDIGTGTGLLSMMAARLGADSVTACEAFKPMSECALKVIRRNGYQNRVRLIPKRSTDLTVGADGDLPAPCNILVTEVFDTELIGEGALATFAHAHRVLLEKECIVVPQSATIYAQVVECPLAQNWNKVQDVYDSEGKLLVRVPPSVRNCAGSAAVHDLQLNQLPRELFRPLLPPIPVLRFDWSGRTPFIFERSTINSVKARDSGRAQAVFMWWELQMDVDNKVSLSCAPYWARPDTDIPWRDHWMQAIYYLPQEVHLTKGLEVSVISSHDEFSLWFSLKTDLKVEQVYYMKPVCECGVHASFSRTRIGQINDSSRTKKYFSLLEKHLDSDSVVLVLGDGFYSSLSASTMATKVYYVETNYLSRRILFDFIHHNQLTKVEVLENLEALHEIKNKISVVLAEPYFLHSILPWDNLKFAYLLKAVKGVLRDDVQVFPSAARIKGIAVRFRDLNKIRLPLGQCEGFQMQDFDDLIERSSGVSDDSVGAEPLWEYPGLALSPVVDIVTLNLNSVPERAVETNGRFQIEQGHGGCNGIALWVDWVHGDSVISSGPTAPPRIGQTLTWDVHVRQGVCLFADRDVTHINYSFKFDFHEGNVSFKWN